MDILSEKRIVAHSYQLPQEEYLKSLGNKLIEESKEVIATETIDFFRNSISAGNSPYALSCKEL